MCIMQTWLELPTPLFLSLPLPFSMTASVNRPQQTIPEAFFPLHPALPIVTFPFSPLSFPFFLYLSRRPTAPALFNSLLPDQH